MSALGARVLNPDPGPSHVTGGDVLRHHTPARPWRTRGRMAYWMKTSIFLTSFVENCSGSNLDPPRSRESWRHRVMTNRRTGAERLQFALPIPRATPGRRPSPRPACSKRLSAVTFAAIRWLIASFTAIFGVSSGISMPNSSSKAITSSPCRASRPGRPRTRRPGASLRRRPAAPDMLYWSRRHSVHLHQWPGPETCARYGHSPPSSCRR